MPRWLPSKPVRGPARYWNRSKVSVRRAREERARWQRRREMERYRMARVTLSWGFGQVFLWCTERQDELLAELGKVLPCQVKPVERAVYNGDEFWWRMDGFGGRHAYAFGWIVRQLCLQGWEPFASGGERNEEEFYVFRKSLE
jgi:hypothetical protein